MADASHSDRARLVRFWASARGFWRGKSAMIAWPLTVGLVVIAVLQLAVQYRLNYWNRDFFNALARHDGDTLWRQVAVFAPLAIMSVGLSVISVWTRMTTQRKWRQWLTTDILGDWLADDHYRKLEAVPGEYKNAEYRISFDAKSATDSPVDLTLGLVNSVMTAGVFTGVLWSVGGGLTIAVGGLMVTIPGYLVIGAVIYALVFTGVMLVIGRNLPSVIQMQSQSEAEFLAAANEIRESGSHPASDLRPQTAECGLGRAVAGAAALASTALAVDGHDVRLADRSFVRAGLRLVSVRAEISRRQHDARRIDTSLGRLRHGSGGVQLAGRQLSAPVGLALRRRPRCRAAARARSGQTVGTDEAECALIWSANQRNDSFGSRRWVG